MTTTELENYYQSTGKYQGPSQNDPYNAELENRERAERLQGNSGYADNSGMFLIAKKLEEGTLTPEDAALARTVLGVIETNSRLSASGSPGLKSLDGMADEAKWNAIGGRLRDWLSGMSTSGVGQIGRRNQTPAGSTQAVGGTVRTLRLQIGNGPSTEVNMASAQDAANLESFLSQLETSAGRST